MKKIMTYSNYLNESFNNRKTLYIMRHAKAESGFRDYERPITKKGEEHTYKIVEYLKRKNVTIDLIFVSPSVRTMETCDIITSEFKIENIRKEKIIYDSDYPEELNILFNNIPNTVNNVMLIGLNPTLTYFVNKFIDNKIRDFPTSGVVALEFEVDEWNQIFNTKPILKFIVFPDMLD